MRYHIITAVWGEQYTNLFLDLCVPNQLNPANLPALAKLAEVTYKIYATSSELNRIAHDPGVQKISSLMRVEILAIDHFFRRDLCPAGLYLHQMSMIHRISAASAMRENAAMVFLSPDSLWSDGFLVKLHDTALLGKRMVMVFAPRTVMEKAVPDIKSRINSEDGCFSLSNRTLTGIGLKHMHPLTKACYADSDIFPESPVLTLWKAQGGLLARSLYLHPLMIWPKVQGALPYGPIDTEYLGYACPDYEDYHVASDSDEITYIELSHSGKTSFLLSPNSFSPEKHSAFVKIKGSHIHRQFLKEKIRYHSENITEDWKAVEAESDRMISMSLSI